MSESNSLNLRDDPELLKIVKENFSLNDLKDYVISNRIFDGDEVSWVHFYWISEIEKILMLLTEEFLYFHFGFRGTKAINNFLQ